MISNEEVLRRMKEKEGFLYNSIVKQKMAFAGRFTVYVDPAATVLFKYWKVNWKARLLKEDLDVCGLTI